MDGQQQLQRLKEAGFSSDEINQWVVDKRNTLSSAGFNQQEIDEYFGKKPFNEAPLREHFNTAFSTAKAQTQGEGEPKPFTFEDALKAGWQSSTAGLALRGELPETNLPEDPTTLQAVGSALAQQVGDIPASVAGFMIGGGAGAATGPGAAITGFGGAVAFPAALRAAMVDAYTNGEIKTPREFLTRASAIMVDTAKAYVTGAAAGGAGVAAGAALPLASTTIGSATRAGAVVTAQTAAAVTSASAVEGELPSADDFINAGALVVVTGGATKAAQKLGTIYKKTGMRPHEVVQDAQVDPTIKQDLLSKNVEIPKAYEEGIDPIFKPKDTPDVPETPAPVADTPEGRILSKINVGGKPPKERMTFSKFYTQVVDDLNPIKDIVETSKTLGETNLPDSQNPYILARLTRGVYGKADHFLKHSPFDFKTLENKGKSLQSILDPLKDDLDGVRAFAVAKRAQELEARGIQSGFKLEDADAVVKNGEAKYGKTVAELHEYQDSLTRYLKDSGILSEEAYQKMTEANKSYVPFYRVLDEESLVGGVGRGLTAHNPLKAIKGSERDVIDPSESIIKNTYAYIALADRNNVGVKFIELTEQFKTISDGGPFGVEKVKTPVRPVDIKNDEMARFLKNQGVMDVPDETLTVFRALRTPLAKDEIAVFRDGKREVYKLHPDLAEAFKTTDGQTMGLLSRILRAPTQWKRAGITLSPEFFPRNVVRDQFDALINSRSGFVPLLDTIRGAMSLLGKDDYYQNWLKSGGANSTLVSMDRQYIQQNIMKLNTDYGIAKNTWNTIKSPVELLRMMSELAENSTRLGEFKKATRGATSKEAITRGGFQSREITLDFARKGANAELKKIASVTAFFNAQLQGIDRIARRFKEDPVGTSIKVGASVTIPSVLLWYVNKDDERVQQLPQWQKDMFWIVATDDWQPATARDIEDSPPYLLRQTNGRWEINKGTLYRIPKPHEVGLIFGSGIEHALNAMVKDDPKAYEAMTKSLREAFLPGYIPDFAQPVLEEWANKSFFTGGPIVPFDVEDALPEVQYTPYTTELTKALGRTLGQFPALYSSKRTAHTVAPATIENYVRQWSGGLGMLALQLADGGLRKAGVLPDPIRPEDTLADIPVIKAFVARHPSGAARAIQDFYEAFNRRQQVINTFEFYNKKELNPVRAMQFAENNPKVLAGNADGIKKALAAQQQFIRLIWKNPEISAVEKRQLIDTTYFQMIETAKQGNLFLKQLDESVAK
jgi:hypothetical protein